MNPRTRRTQFKNRVREWAVRVRVEPKQIRIQRMTRKWASCSTHGWCTFASDLLGVRVTRCLACLSVRRIDHLAQHCLSFMSCS